MAQVFLVDLSGMDAFSATNLGASASISGAGSVDTAAMLSSAATALGPIAADYLAAYGQAQANNLAATRLVAEVHAAVARATCESKAAIVAADNA